MLLQEKTADLACDGFEAGMGSHYMRAKRPRSFLKTINWCFAVVYLIYNSQLNGPWATSDGTGRIAGATITNLVGFVITAILTLGLVLLALPNWRGILRALWKSPFLVLLLGLGVLSSVWSATPLFTLRRAVLVVFSSFAGLYLGVTFTVAEQVRLLRITAFLIILACFVVIPFPAISYHLDGPVTGAFRGVFFHKNPLGRFLAFSACLVFIGRRGIQANFFRLAPLAALAILLLIARSATAVMVTVVMAVVIKLIQILLTVRGRKSQFGAMVIGMGLFVMMMLAVAAQEAILPFLGRDASLTGRAPLWAAVIDAISRRPLLGYGLGGYFEYPFYQAQVSSAAGWYAVHAHNGFLQLAIELGVVGLGLFLLLALSCIVKTVRHMRESPHDGLAAWPVVFLSFLILYNLTEASLFHGNNLFWILFVAIWTSLGRETDPIVVRASDSPGRAASPLPAFNDFDVKPLAGELA